MKLLTGNTVIKRVAELLEKILSSGDLANYSVAIDSLSDNDTKRIPLDKLKIALNAQGLYDDRGAWDASGNVFPSTGGTGNLGAILRANTWTISVPGTLGGTPVIAGQEIRALVDSPGQTAANWHISGVGSGFKTISKENTFTPAMVFDKDEKYCDPHTQAGAISISLGGNTNGAVSYIYASIFTDGSSISFPLSWREITNEYLNDTGLYGLIVFYDGNEYQYYMYKIRDIDLTPPTLDSCEIGTTGDDILNLVFSEPVDISTDGWTITTDGAALSIASVSSSGTATPAFTLSRVVLYSETITLDYDDATGDTKDAYNNTLVSINDFSVTNNVSDPTNVIFENVGSNLSATGNDIGKINGLNPGWGVSANNGANTSQKITGNGYIDVFMDEATKGCQFGLATTQTLFTGQGTGSVHSIQTGVGSGAAYYYNNGTYIGSKAGGYVANSYFRINRTGTTVTYQYSTDGVNYSTFYTSPNTSTGDLYFMVDFYDNAKSILNCKLVNA